MGRRAATASSEARQSPLAILAFLAESGRPWIVAPVGALFAARWLGDRLLAPLLAASLPAAALLFSPILLVVELLLRRFAPVSTAGTVRVSTAPNAAIY